MGVNNTVLSKKSSVNYKVLNNKSYHSGWRGFEKHRPCTLGQEITSKVLYDDSL